MRLINADDLLTEPHFIDETIPERILFIEDVNNSPTINPVKHSRWICEKYAEGRIKNFYCESCGPEVLQFVNGKYCPNCGAMMGKVVERII